MRHLSSIPRIGASPARALNSFAHMRGKPFHVLQVHNIVWMISEKLDQPFPCARGACAALPGLYRACTHTMLCRKFARNRPCVRPNLQALEAVLSGSVPLGEPGQVEVAKWAATESSEGSPGRRSSRRRSRQRRRALRGVAAAAGGAAPTWGGAPGSGARGAEAGNWEEEGILPLAIPLSSAALGGRAGTMRWSNSAGGAGAGERRGERR